MHVFVVLMNSPDQWLSAHFLVKETPKMKVY